MINALFAHPWFKLDQLNGFVVLAVILFSVLTLVYSYSFIRGRMRALKYYTYIILTAIASIAAVLANNLILLLIFWGFLGLTLYLLINMGTKDSGPAAKKAFIIIGGTDALMLLGIGLIYYMTGTFQMDKLKIDLTTTGSALAVSAYLCIAVACFAKAGAMPFHSWIPDCAENAPVPVVAFFPASLDKLLGIYLLARISLDLFVISQAINIFLMLIGAITIIAALMMALIQQELKRLIGYLMISGAGYMILGIGIGNPIGIAGGLFYMLNSAIATGCLFLTAGNVEYNTHSSDLRNLGGLAKSMPITFISALIAGLSISGVPPFNGFVSKWMIYQGLIEQFSSSGLGQAVSVLCLAAAMFGSGLTLASFMKLLHATYLGRAVDRGQKNQPGEVPAEMWLPCLILAVICVVFGVFAYQLPLRGFILPAVGGIRSPIGSWYAQWSTLLIIIGLILGLMISRLRVVNSPVRKSSAFIGGEVIALGETRVTGTDFYNTIRDFANLKSIYSKAERGVFDIYEQSKRLVFAIGRFFQYLHNGVLPTYLVWTLLGMIGLFFVLIR